MRPDLRLQGIDARLYNEAPRQKVPRCCQLLNRTGKTAVSLLVYDATYSSLSREVARKESVRSHANCAADWL